MKTTLIIILVIMTSIGLASCTDLYTGPNYPVVSTGAPILQSHHPHYRHHRYRRYAAAPVVHTGGGITQRY